MRLTRFLRRAATKPPHVVARRAVAELRVSVDRVTAPRRARRLDETTLLRSLDAPSLDDLWRRLLERPYLAPIPSEEDLGGDGAEAARVRVAAIAACARRIDLLGTGLVELGEAIEWSLDFKSGRRWAPGYAPRIAYVDYADDSDVKIPWELSRLHWLLPAGQAFALTGDECYAEATRDVIDEWIAANPCSDGQLDRRDGGCSADHLLDMALPRMRRESRVGQSRISSSLPSCALPPRGIR